MKSFEPEASRFRGMTTALAVWMFSVFALWMVCAGVGMVHAWEQLRGPMQLMMMFGGAGNSVEAFFKVIFNSPPEVQLLMACFLGWGVANWTFWFNAALGVKRFGALVEAGLATRDTVAAPPEASTLLRERATASLRTGRILRVSGVVSVASYGAVLLLATYLVERQHGTIAMLFTSGEHAPYFQAIHGSVRGFFFLAVYAIPFMLWPLGFFLERNTQMVAAAVGMRHSEPDERASLFRLARWLLPFFVLVLAGPMAMIWGFILWPEDEYLSFADRFRARTIFTTLYTALYIIGAWTVIRRWTRRLADVVHPGGSADPSINESGLIHALLRMSFLHRFAAVAYALMLILMAFPPDGMREFGEFVIEGVNGLALNELTMAPLHHVGAYSLGRWFFLGAMIFSLAYSVIMALITRGGARLLIRGGALAGLAHAPSESWYTRVSSKLRRHASRMTYALPTDDAWSVPSESAPRVALPRRSIRGRFIGFSRYSGKMTWWGLFVMMVLGEVVIVVPAWKARLSIQDEAKESEVGADWIFDAMTRLPFTVDAEVSFAHAAAAEGRVDVLADLDGIEDMNAIDEDGRTLLDYARRADTLDTVRWLLERGAQDAPRRPAKHKGVELPSADCLGGRGDFESWTYIAEVENKIARDRFHEAVAKGWKLTQGPRGPMVADVVGDFYGTLRSLRRSRRGAGRFGGYCLRLDSGFTLNMAEPLRLAEGEKLLVRFYARGMPSSSVAVYATTATGEMMYQEARAIGADGMESWTRMVHEVRVSPMGRNGPVVSLHANQGEVYIDDLTVYKVLLALEP